MNKCGHCGKFISYKHIKSKEAKYFFTPDNAFSAESSYWICKNCMEKIKLGEHGRPHARSNSIRTRQRRILDVRNI